MNRPVQLSATDTGLFRPSLTNPRISPLTVVKYECPQQSLLIITADLETNKIEPRSDIIITCSPLNPKSDDNSNNDKNSNTTNNNKNTTNTTSITNNNHDITTHNITNTIITNTTNENCTNNNPSRG